jgi:Tfp pilus assembly protein PilX
MDSSPSFMQRGIASVISLLFLVTVVLLMLSKSLEMSGSKNLEAQQHVDSVAAMALAESGKAAAVADITQAAMGNSAAFTSHCAKYASSVPVNTAIGNAITLAPGSIQYVGASIAPSTYQCPIRVKGTVGTANHTVEVWVTLNPTNGTAGYGTDISLTLNNPYTTPAIGFFNLAWRRLGSTGQNPPGGQADASCATPLLPAICGTLWNTESSSGLPSVGGYASQVQNVGTPGSVDVHQALTVNRNFAEVGLFLGSASSMAPGYQGMYTDKQDTVNTQNNSTTTGKAPSGDMTGGWCQGADTLVFGVSGRANDDTTSQYTSMVFNSSGSPAQPIFMQRAAHYSGTAGDIFSEVWFTTNPTLQVAGVATKPIINAADSSTGTITLSSSVDLTLGTIIKAYSGTGQFIGGTTIASCVDGANCKGVKKFTTSTAISSSLASKLIGSQICGGICALFDAPASTTQKTIFSLTRSNTAAQQWAAGFACYSGVDPNKIIAITKQKVTVDKWHEVTSSD